MEVNDDDLPFLAPNEHPSPAGQRKLKRLKKPSKVLEVTNTPGPSLNPSHSHASDISGSEDVPQDDNNPDPERLVDPSSPVSRWVGFGKDMDSVDGLDPLFGDPGPLEEWDAVNQETAEEDFESFGETLGGSKGSGKGGDVWMKGKTAKKRLSLEPGEDNASKKKKKNTTGKRGAEDGKPKKSILNKRKLEKERKAYLEQLHAESQRLLRETRDASFKLVPLVQKPISAVLEKIRQRKQEMLKKSSGFNGLDSFADADSLKSNSCNVAESESSGRGNNKSDKWLQDIYSGGAKNLDISEDPESFQANMQSIMDESSVDPPHNNDENYHSDDQPDNPPDERKAQPLSGASPKLDSSPLDDVSSDEDFNKENIAPSQSKPLIIMDVYESSNHLKAFIDDEAEEEDDSDNDLMRFQEDEEDDEGDEVPNDLISSGYKEMPIDHEKRNQFHQIWLEKQDAAATENVLQRLKYPQKQEDPLLNNEENADKSGDDSDKSSDEPVPRNLAHQNFKKAKQMMAQMFTDVDDKYISDGEENEQTLYRQHILEQTEERASFLSADDGNSTEVFCLIKKLNIAPDPKRRSRTTSTALIGGNSSISSKSSFLGRAASNSLPSSHRQGSIAVRSFIFGRDDSNSRSGISNSDKPADTDWKENIPVKAASARFSYSQSRTARSKQKPVSGSSSELSLFETLRRPSTSFEQKLQSNQNRSSITAETQAVNQFMAFKLGKKVSKRLTQEA